MYFFCDCRANVWVPQHHNSSTECVKDLGVYVNRKLKWNTHTQVKLVTAAELSTSLRILYIGALHHISNLSSTSPILFQYSSMVLKSVAFPLQTSGLSRISKNTAWDGFMGVLGITWTLFSHIKSYRWLFESILRIANCSFSWFKVSYWATSLIMLKFNLLVLREDGETSSNSNVKEPLDLFTNGPSTWSTFSIVMG